METVNSFKFVHVDVCSNSITKNSFPAGPNSKLIIDILEKSNFRAPVFYFSRVRERERESFLFNSPSSTKIDR